MANPLLKGLAPVHPGEVLREDVLPALGRTKAEVARLLGVSRQTLYDILNARKPVTPQMALRLSRLLGGAPEMWARLQTAYDLQVIEPGMAGELAAIPLLRAA